VDLGWELEQLQADAQRETTRAVAVLPFVDLSREKDQDYLCEGHEAAIRARPEDYQSPLLVGQVFDDLGRSVRAGMRNRGWLEHDSNLDAIRSHPRFQALMRGLA
jgi:hypothetical protein